ncbi:hypothetical protein MKW94_016194 [Papaver nudicaule]|uniref:N-acetyltransferase domain-containing protein n=1 Tax=Papaver nudicaule TaxID=74823 RepID=A0AA41VWH7_PAPNU|nr:hypothetical protein [Papaver nudicaule]
MLMSMNVFQQTTPKLLSFPSVSCHGRRIPSHSSSQLLVSSPATTMEFNSKFLNIHSCHGIQHSSSATMRFSPVFALPKDNEEEPIIQDHDEEYRTLISPDNVKEEQSKKVSGGEAKKVECLVREATVDEFWASARLKARMYAYPSHDRYASEKKQAEKEHNAILEGYKNQDFMCIIAVRKEGENELNGLFEIVIGTLDFRVIYHPKKHGIISNVIVAESARQQGVGSNMLKFILEYAKGNGVTEVFLYVHRDNYPALELYRKMGFGVIPDWSEMPHLKNKNLYICGIIL